MSQGRAESSLPLLSSAELPEPRRRRRAAGGARGARADRDGDPVDAVHALVDHTAVHILEDLAGRDLMCFCPLGQPCHADILLTIANPP